MGSLFGRRKKYHKAVHLIVSSPVRLGDTFESRITVTASNKGVRVESLRCSLVLADVNVKEEIVDAPMGLTVPFESFTKIWNCQETVHLDIQLEPGQSQDFPFRLTVGQDQLPSALGEPERRWTLTVEVGFDAPRPEKSRPYQVQCLETVEVLSAVD